MQLAPLPWYRRAWTSMTGWFRGAPVVAQSAPERPLLGSDYAGPWQSRPGYEVEASLAAFAAFPWVYAACIRGARDLAGLPLVVVKGRRANAVALDDHVLYDLLEQPSPRVTGRQFRAQQFLDVVLAGNHLALVSGGSKLSTVLQRLHPRRVHLEVDPKEGWGDYLYRGGAREVRLPAASVLHTRTPSWADDPRGLWGTGAIEALHNDLTTDKRASASAAVLARRGRPDLIVSPKDPSRAEKWTEPFRKALKENLDRLLENGGTVVTNGEVDIHTPSWTPRDIEFPKLRELVREAVLAVTGVPPHLVGLPVANYAQAEAQERAYWERLTALAGDIEDACWNPLARRFGPDLRVRHDFSGVDVLQNGRTLRQQRVKGWVDLGVSLADAAAYEGFHDLPTPAQGATPTEPQTRDFHNPIEWFSRSNNEDKNP